MLNEKIDIKENRLLELNKDLLVILLKDNTTKKNLIWATDNYKKKGSGYSENSHILLELITGYHGNVIKPRIEKNKKEQQSRSREKAEVFTPSWVCNAQNNLIDNAWFEQDNIFNTEQNTSWKTNHTKIPFPTKTNKTWQDYVLSTRLEITCGEAPYITSRYDTVTGDYIEVKNRIGFLDRKLRVVAENTANENEWLEWALKAMQSSYGYDWQGDNVLLARENVLYTIMEFYTDTFQKAIDTSKLLEFAHIISWNIWQMDGLKYVIPNSCCTEREIEHTLFGTEETETECIGCKKNDAKKHNGIYCKIMDWEIGTPIKFVSLQQKGS